MRLSSEELELIKQEIERNYSDVSVRYNNDRYPDRVYEKCKKAFSQRKATEKDIDTALRWKYGHLKKENIPESHKVIIQDIIRIWSEYPQDKRGVLNPRVTFEYWLKALDRKTSFITAVFITHLSHPKNIPMIDQHNYRAMNALLKLSGREGPFKKKPSQWEDVDNLTRFMKQVSKFSGIKLRDLEKYLVSFGRHFVDRDTFDIVG